jgi:hypothetical protein
MIVFLKRLTLSFPLIMKSLLKTPADYETGLPGDLLGCFS